MSEAPKDPRTHSSAAAPSASAGPDGGPGAGTSGSKTAQKPTGKSSRTEAARSIWATPVVIVGMLLVALLGVLAILWAWKLWPFTTTVMTTEDAYVQGQVTVLAPQVNGYITYVGFSDYQRVRQGDLLFKIDDRLYRASLEQSEAQLEQAQANLDNAEQQIHQNEATIVQKKADIYKDVANRENTNAEEKRVDDLASRGSVSLRERDSARASNRSAAADIVSAKADLRIARETLKSTLVSRENLRAKVDEQHAARDAAQVNLANTVIRAPRDGQVSAASVRPGQYVAAGTQLLYLVPNEVWVVANYKETQTHALYVGAPATLQVDALRGLRLRGRVTDLAPATGSQFSVLKPDNATGNFTKVVQRVPIRIDLLADQPDAARLRPGLSVTARIDTAGAPHSDARR